MHTQTLCTFELPRQVHHDFEEIFMYIRTDKETLFRVNNSAHGQRGTPINEMSRISPFHQERNNPRARTVPHVSFKSASESVW